MTDPTVDSDGPFEFPHEEALRALERHCLSCVRGCRPWWEYVHGLDRTGLGAHVPSSACCELGNQLHADYIRACWPEDE